MHDKVYVELHTPLVLKYDFDEISYDETDTRDEYSYEENLRSERHMNNLKYNVIEKIYKSLGIRVNKKTIYNNISDIDLETINEQMKQYGFKLLILSANSNYKEIIKLNAHAILRVI